MNHWDEKMFPWDGATPKFYPPGQHPALTKMYAELRRAEGIAVEAPAMGPEVSREFYRYLNYLRQHVADFEAREAELKAEAYYRNA